MPRARNVPATRKRRKKVLKKARGYFGNKSRLFRYAKDAVDRAESYAYVHRRKLKNRVSPALDRTDQCRMSYRGYPIWRVHSWLSQGRYRTQP